MDLWADIKLADYMALMSHLKKLLLGKEGQLGEAEVMEAL